MSNFEDRADELSLFGIDLDFSIYEDGDNKVVLESVTNVDHSTWEVPEGVTDITSNAFDDADVYCVVIPSTVTLIEVNALGRIGKLIFEEGGNQPLRIGSSAFLYDPQESPTEIVFPDRLIQLGLPNVNLTSLKQKDTTFRFGSKFGILDLRLAEIIKHLDYSKFSGDTFLITNLPSEAEAEKYDSELILNKATYGSLTQTKQEKLNDLFKTVTVV